MDMKEAAASQRTSLGWQISHLPGQLHDGKGLSTASGNLN